MENQNNQLLLLRFLQIAEDRNWLEVVDIKKILVPNLLIYIYRISSYSCRGNYSFLNSSSEETIQVFLSLM